MKIFRKKEPPLTDIPGKLLNTRSRVTNGRMEWTETKFNLEEYNRIKPIIDKWFKNEDRTSNQGAVG